MPPEEGGESKGALQGLDCHDINLSLVMS
ncbi:Hypothetical protein, putative [Bodo saltans]|uniref:Uncharacterized protein n=1 Tax=Bodo saltans TaxID=75058 RepID=A0A0S4JC16_BODSA|nr:Hypothetical protein, putative [Bodo saltans]|eukprot:CUG87502.1 Hypothetical protein, putative [Bodo saltans]